MILLALAGLAAGCSSSNSSTPASPSSTTNAGTPVSIVAGASVLTSTAYSPNSLTITHGNAVTFTNNDSTSHTATASGNFDTGLIAPGGSKTVTLTTAGTVTYRCTIHPGMVGTIVVQ